MEKTGYILLVFYLLFTGTGRVEGGESLTARLEGDRFLFRILHRDKILYFSLAGQSDTPDSITIRPGLQYKSLIAGSLQKKGFLREIGVPFSASVTSSLYGEEPGFRGDVSLRPSARQGLVLSSRETGGIALTREDGFTAAWVWMDRDFLPDLRLQPCFVLSFPSLEGKTELQSVYSFKPHSPPLLYSGVRISMEEDLAGLDLFSSLLTSGIGRPGFYGRFRFFWILEAGRFGRFESAVLGRRISESYTDPGGAFIEKEGDLHIRLGWNGGWGECAVQGELSREKITPVPRRFIPVNRRFSGTARIGSELLFLEVYGEVQAGYDEAGLFHPVSRSRLSAGFDLEHFRAGVWYHRNMNSEGRQEELIEVSAGWSLSPFKVELKADSDPSGRLRLDFNPPGASGTAAFFLLEAENTPAGVRMEVSLGWSCSVE